MSSPAMTETKPETNTGEAATPPPPAELQRAGQRAPVAFDADDPVSLYMNTGIFEQLLRVGKMMALSSLVPEHLRGDKKVGDCALVAAQAFRWRMDPFSVSQHTFVLKGKLGYEGKLIAAVVNSSGKLVGSLGYAYSGQGRDRKVVVSGRLKGEKEDRTVGGTVSGWATDNEQWKNDPDQILAYRGAREWARRHTPEVLLGVHAEEEIGETVTLERGTDGSFAPRSLDDLAEKLTPATSEVVAPHPPTLAAVRCKVHPDVDLSNTDSCWKCTAEAKEKAEVAPKTDTPATPARKPGQSRLQE